MFTMQGVFFGVLVNWVELLNGVYRTTVQMEHMVQLVHFSPEKAPKIPQKQRFYIDF